MSYVAKRLSCGELAGDSMRVIKGWEGDGKGIVAVGAGGRVCMRQCVAAGIVVGSQLRH
jgi:hypothetical protein